MDDDTPTQLQQDLAGSLRETAGALRDCERQVATTRQRVQTRVAELERTERRLADSASRAVNAQNTDAAMTWLLNLERTRAALEALRDVLDLL